MSSDDLVRGWKDPDQRASGDAGDEHPAGGIELSKPDAAIEAVGATTWACFSVITVTTSMSCWPSCASTYSKGTCAYGSVGCCPAE